jgi:hypothetical protein
MKQSVWLNRTIVNIYFIKSKPTKTSFFQKLSSGKIRRTSNKGNGRPRRFLVWWKKIIGKAKEQHAG